MVVALARGSIRGLALMVSQGQTQEKKDKSGGMPEGLPDMATLMKKWKETTSPGAHAQETGWTHRRMGYENEGLDGRPDHPADRQ
jgi:hypothetical protein